MNIFNLSISKLNFVSLSSNEQKLIEPEIIQLQTMLTQRIVAEQTYQNFLLMTANNVDLTQTEADILEKLVPLWVENRQHDIPHNTPIDDFYRDIEYTLLLKLTIELFSENTFETIKLKKMREIIRRYSIMPNFWQYLCTLSGNKPTDAYTF